MINPQLTYLTRLQETILHWMTTFYHFFSVGVENCNLIPINGKMWINGKICVSECLHVSMSVNIFGYKFCWFLCVGKVSMTVQSYMNMSKCLCVSVCVWNESVCEYVCLA